MSRTPLPEKPTLADFQSFIAEIVDEKGWTRDPDELFVLMNEEIGEFARHLRHSWKKGIPAVHEGASSEMADMFMYLVDLANAFGIDLEKAVRDKVAYNDTRKDFGH